MTTQLPTSVAMHLPLIHTYIWCAELKHVNLANVVTCYLLVCSLLYSVERRTYYFLYGDVTFICIQYVININNFNECA